MHDLFPINCADDGIDPGKPGSPRYMRLLRQWLRGEALTLASYEGLHELAEMLGGEVGHFGNEWFGGFITCPAPGAPASDRSMVVKVDPRRPRDFYVYACPEHLISSADAYVRELLRLPEQESEGDIAERVARALDVWNNAALPAGTLVETYLRSRRLCLPPQPVIRFHPDLYHGDAKSSWPAMVALLTDVHDQPTGVHLTYLARDGTGKAPIHRELQRRTRGVVKGSGIRLATGDGRLLVGEGIETVLSVRAATGRPAMAVGGAAFMASLALPEDVQDVTILVDGDDAGRKNSAEAASAFGKQGRSVALYEAPEGKDFNDVLMEENP